MKRGSERQLTADANSDSDDGDNAGAGSWEKASGDVLSQRKILRVKRKEPAVAPSGSLSSSGANTFSSNPFGAMKGFVAAAPAAQPAVSAASAFPKGFTFGAPAVAPVVSSGEDGKRSSGNPANPETGFSKFATFSSSARGSDSSSAPMLSEKTASVHSTIAATATDGSYGAKMTQLNQALLEWMRQQQEQAPLGLWSKGLEDYVLHAERLAKEFGVHRDAGAKPAPVAAGPPATSTLAVAKTVPVPTVPAAATNKALFAPTLPIIPAASAPAPAFTFGGADSSSAGAGFSWGKSAEAPSPAFSGTFSLPPNAASALPKPTFGLKTPAVSTGGFGFGFGASAGPSAPSAALAPAPAGDADGDDEPEPILEPEVILRDVNDKDEILFQAECSLRRLDTKAEPKPEWKDVGKGSLRVTLDPTTGVRRILVREKSMGKVTLNASFFAAQKFEKVKKNSIKFAAVVPDLDAGAAEGATSLNCFIIKTKESDTDNAIAALISARDSRK